jgi:flagellar biosynthesis/type III secretory pathway ATPase
MQSATRYIAAAREAKLAAEKQLRELEIAK